MTPKTKGREKGNPTSEAGKKIILDLCGGTGSWSKPYKNAGYDVRVVTLPNHDVRHAFFEGEWIIFPSIYQKMSFHLKIVDVYGVLAAPPCTMFSYARTKARKPRDFKEGMVEVEACLRIIWGLQYKPVSDTAKYTTLKFWALENPMGMLQHFLGYPPYGFNPYDFGDHYQKHTHLWGRFNYPQKNPIELTVEEKLKHKTNSQELPKLGRGLDALFPSPAYRYPKCSNPLGHSWCMKDKVYQCAECHIKKMTKFDYLKSKDIHPEFFGKYDRQTRRSITPAGFSKAFMEANP